MPVLIAVLTIIGLLSALLSEGFWKDVSWLLLTAVITIPILFVMAFYYKTKYLKSNRINKS